MKTKFRSLRKEDIELSKQRCSSEIFTHPRIQICCHGSIFLSTVEALKYCTVLKTQIPLVQACSLRVLRHCCCKQLNL